MISILAWIILGLVAGAVAKWIHPGPDPGGWIVTMLIGIGGAMVGGFIARALLGINTGGFNLMTFLVAVGGAVLLLFLYRRFIVGRARS